MARTVHPMFSFSQEGTSIGCTGTKTHSMYDRKMLSHRPYLHGLLAIRQSTGLTQEAFGELVGLTEVSVRRMETERQGFTASSVERIAHVSKRNWWEVFGYRHPPEATLSDETIATIEIMERLTPEARQKALDLVRTAAAWADGAEVGR